MNVVVVGGTGGFGLSICRMLLADGHAVTAVGRDRTRGETAARTVDGLRFLAMDRREIGTHILDGLATEIVVDASGPFQGLEPRLAEAAMEAGVHYVDIADDRSYVARIRGLDTDARERRLVVVSGASSVPALSSAVAIDLSRGLRRVDRVDVSISASSQAAFGTSVLASMLSGAGRPIRHSGSASGVGMMEYRQVSFSSGRHRLTRHVLSCDVPDHDELAPLLPGAPDVRFRAGSELPVHNWTMWLVALLVRKGLLSDATRIMPLARIGRRVMLGSGDGRSAMKVEVRGDDGEGGVLHEWTLVATGGHGPTIPCLVVPEIVNMIARNEIGPGARSAAGLVETSAILARMPEGSIATTVERSRPVPLYARIMGERFQRLDPAVRKMHDDPWITKACGRATVTASTSPLARLICRLVGFPPASSDLPVAVTFERLGAEEKWTRQFGRHTFQSRLSQSSGDLLERFGPLCFRFSLEERDGAIAMIHRGWTAFGIRMPRRLGPSGTAVESGKGELFTFDVPISLPLLGEVVRYRGWLQAAITRK